LCFPAHIGILSELRFPLFAQVMQINGIKNDAALWRVQTNICNVLARKIAPA
jgi:hypothetical protein